MIVYWTVPAVTAATVGVIVATIFTSVGPTPIPLGEAVDATPHHAPNLAAALLIAARPAAVTSVAAQYKAAVVPSPMLTLAAVEPVNATVVSMKMSTI
jgi:hypothetical protein